jgi:hypothetical protein
MVGRIQRETAFPRPAPVAVGLSQTYYETWPESHLIVAPITESRFLLHLPDLYHELGHLLFRSDDDARTAPFLHAYRAASVAGYTYLVEERRREEQTSRPPWRLRDRLTLWARLFDLWTEELACDLFAIAACGPAFAWAHVHLWIKRGDDPWALPVAEERVHPCDAARLECALEGLRLLGFDEDAVEIRRHWEEATSAAGVGETPEYRRCFPPAVLLTVAEHVVKGVEAIGVRRAEPGNLGAVAAVLNEAWRRFLHDPDRYAEWERDAADRLMGSTGMDR